MPRLHANVNGLVTSAHFCSNFGLCLHSFFSAPRREYKVYLLLTLRKINKSNKESIWIAKQDIQFDVEELKDLTLTG